MPITPSSLKSPPLYQKVYEVLRRAILVGELQPGEHLAETQVAERLGISRTPLREALRQLQTEGLVRQTEAGLTVVALDLTEVQLMYECRTALEKIAVARAAAAAGPTDVALLRAALDRSRQSVGGSALPELLNHNVDFHRQIALTGGNPWSLKLLEQTWSQMILFRASVLSTPEDEQQVLAEHEGILASIAAHDPAVALARMEAHLMGDLERGRRQLVRLGRIAE